MRKHIRKPIPFLAAFLAIALAYFLSGQGTLAHAEGADAGGTMASAKVIELDTVYSETTASWDDEDFFRFTATEHGYFQVHLKHNEEDGNEVNEGWDVNVLDGNGNVITSKSRIEKNWTSIIIPYAEPGKTFYVQVFSHDQYGCPLDCVYDLTVKQTASEEWESEPNETIADADTIRTGKVYHGITVKASDEDYFKFTTTVHGYFQVSLTHNLADSNNVGQGWDVNVLDGDGEVITSGSRIGKNWTSIIIPYAEPGKTFYVQVFSHDQYGCPLDCVYDLTVKQTASEEWESEPNETIADADTIRTGKVYHGITVKASDEDYFKFTTTVHGYFQVSLTHNPADNNNVGQGWDVNVLDGNGEVITSGSKIENNWNSIILPYAKPGKVFYVQVFSHSQYGCPLDCVYDLKVTQKTAASWESEPNGTKKAAIPIKAGKTYNGITETSNDGDYFKLGIQASGKVKVRFSSNKSNPSGSIGQGWNVSVYDKKSKEVAKVQGVKTTDSVSFDVKKGTYYIKIEPSSSWSAPEGCRYTLLADYTKAPSAPKISSVKAGKKSAVVKWKKVSGATGYYVYRSTSKKGGFKKVQTLKRASALSWKNQKLKSGKKYYYKVAAYKKVKGMTVVSPYSAVKSVKVK